MLVSGYAITASEDGAPTDSVSLDFARIRVEYKPQKADGTLGASTKAGWDVKTNAKVWPRGAGRRA